MDRPWFPPGTVVRAGAKAHIDELESLARPIAQAIAALRRLPEIQLPASEDERIGVFMLKQIRGLAGKGWRQTVRDFEVYARGIEALEAAMKKTSANVPWFRREQ